MATSYKQMLQTVLKSFPKEERLDFLRELMVSLEPEDRVRLMAELAKLFQSGAPGAAPIVSTPPPASAPAAVPGPNRSQVSTVASPIQAVAPSAAMKSVAVPADQPPPARTPQPAAAVSPVVTAVPVADGKVLSDEEKKALVEAAFKDAMLRNPSTPPTKNWSEFFSCLGYVVLAVGVIAGLGYVGGRLWEML